LAQIFNVATKEMSKWLKVDARLKVWL